MAKETKAERQLREEAAADLQYNEFKQTYHNRFASAMFMFMNLSHEGFSVSEGNPGTYVFTRYEKDAWNGVLHLPATLPEFQDWALMTALTEVEEMFRAYMKEKAEAERKSLVRQTALAKLSKEERELLGV